MVNDFFVKYDPKIDSKADLARKILYNLFITRGIKDKRAVKIGLFGQSGSGKSWSNIGLQSILLEAMGLDIRNYLNDINVYLPIEYPEKLNRLLGLNPGGFKKTGLKKVNIITVHESREFINSKKWQSFVNMAIADVNQMSRQIKRIMFILTSQFIKDIDSSIRYTLDYYIKAHRPFNNSTRLYIKKVWFDDRDLEKPKIKKRGIAGVLMYPNGKWKRYKPSYLIMEKPAKDIIELYERSDTDAKKQILKSKLDRLIKEMTLEVGVEDAKVDKIVEHYMKNPETISTISKRVKDRYVIKKEFREMFDLDDKRMKEFQAKLNQELKEKGFMG